MTKKGDLLTSLGLHGKSYLGAVTSKKVSVGSEEYQYFEGGQGPTILLLHGFAITKAFWRTTATQLISHYHVIALDIPGLNILDAPPSGRCTYGNLSKWLEAFVDHQNLSRFHIIAQGLCSGLAIQYSADHPSRVESLCLLCPPRWSNSKHSPKAPMFYLLDILEKESPQVAIDQYFKTITHENINISSVAKSFYAKIVQKRGERIKNLLKDLEGSFIHVQPRMGLVSCPVLLIYGDKNAFADEDFRELLLRSFKKAELHIIEQCSQLPSVEHPREFHGLISQFMQDILPGN